MLDFALATYEEICREIGSRLRTQRLAQAMGQEELAARSGLSLGTVKNIEAKGQASLESLIRIIGALGLVDELAPLFQMKVQSIADMQQVEGTQRKRAPRRLS